MLVAGVRWKGKYEDTGKAMQQVGKHAGRHIRGKAMNLYYDGEHTRTRTSNPVSR